MSESPVTESTVEPVEPVVEPITIDDLDDLGRMMLASTLTASEQISAASAIVAAANSDDANLMVTTLRPQHARYDEWQAAIEAAELIRATIDEENRPLVKMPSADEVSAAEAVVAELQVSAKHQVDYLTKQYGPGIAGMIPENLGKRRKSTKSGGTTGTKRPRLSGILVTREGTEAVSFTADDTGDRKATFTNLAKYLASDGGGKVDVQTLQDHAFEVAGTQDLSTVNGVTEFGVTVGKNHYTVAVEAKSGE